MFSPGVQMSFYHFNRSLCGPEALQKYGFYEVQFINVFFYASCFWHEVYELVA